MSNALFCLASSETIANNIVSKLKSAAFKDNDISVLFQGKSSTKDFANKMQTKAPDGAVVGMGVSELDADRYEKKIEAGSILICVHTDDADERSAAKKIFKNERATDIAEANAAPHTITQAKPNVVIRNTSPQPMATKDKSEKACCTEAQPFKK